MTTPSVAAGAYANLARLADPSSGLAKAVGEAASQGGSFGSLLKDVVGSVAQTGRNSDAQTRALVDGKANLVDVVTAVADTETAIQTLVSVRDKVIQAYQSIMQMQI